MDAKNVEGSNLKKLEKRWTAPLIQAGYTVIPNAILLRQQALGLDSLDLNIIAQIASYWWSKEKLPYPSKVRIAKAIGIDPSTVRRRLARLEGGGLISRIPRKSTLGGNDTNEYDLGPLIKAATPYALEMLQEIDSKKKAKLAKLAKKGKPKLSVVK